jgi:glutamate racemase
MGGRIGVFDSGVGGLTVVKAIVEALPAQSLVFLGDTARVPYGTRGAEVITRFALELADFLVEKDVEYLVAACNTISSTCLEALQRAYDVPVVGVVDPAVREAVQTTRSGRIGVIGTRATIGSGVYEQKIRRLDAGIDVCSAACPLFVPLAEEGMVDSKAAELIAKDYLSRFEGKGIDVLILGCTHYPLLSRVIQKALGPDVTLVDSARPLAQDLEKTLEKEPSGGKADYELCVTDAPERVVEVASTFFGDSLPAPLTKVSLG